MRGAQGKEEGNGEELELSRALQWDGGAEDREHTMFTKVSPFFI